jgi:hypothetical protein
MTHSSASITTELSLRRLHRFSLPRQHSMTHYPQLICMFGAPNGLCLSITESKHIKAVKEPWHRSNCYNALGQMLLTNQRLDKLAAARVHFSKLGMLNGTCLADALCSSGLCLFKSFVLMLNDSVDPDMCPQDDHGKLNQQSRIQRQYRWPLQCQCGR